ncbi:MAG: gas vesicle protein GvpN, partial [Chloroflexi bacterium]|nr:gas vesicle protein GvpN [Chloroflexota bacterium]
VRGCIMVARALKVRNGSVAPGDGMFKQVCQDILASEASRGGSKSQTYRLREFVTGLLDTAEAGGTRQTAEKKESTGA